MTKFRFLKIAGLGLAILLVTFTRQFATATPGNSVNNDPCELATHALRKAARRAAYSDFWVRVAVCVQEDPGNIATCIIEAREEVEEELDLTADQFEARMELCEELGEVRYNPEIDPNDFTCDITNPLFPFVVGRTLIYQGQTAEGLEVIEVTALPDTVEIEGVECRVVRDVATLDGELIEDTFDWYAQDGAGNVWYFGEVARNFEDGFLEDLGGSWRFGKEGAKPGIVMLAAPAVGMAYRQEYAPSVAEDAARVCAINLTVTVPTGTYTGCLKTEDFTPIEPDQLEEKFYAPGIGVVMEVNPESGEMVQLVQIINP